MGDGRSLGDVYVYEAPAVFTACWKAVSVFLPEAIRSHIHFINHKTGWGEHSHLLEVLPNLPTPHHPSPPSPGFRAPLLRSPIECPCMPVVSERFWEPSLRTCRIWWCSSGDGELRKESTAHAVL
jgi:CRAL/TRIO domain